MWLFLVLVAVPTIEIGLFIQVGGFIGIWPTLAIVIVTAFIGSSLIRVQGRATLEALKNSVNSGANPAFFMAHGALILVAGVLLLTPGFFTDATGLLLMVPPIRSAIIRWGTARAQTQFMNSAANTPGAPIEGEFEVVDDDEPGNSDWTKRP
ncbi:MAG: FxsA family protein [Rhodobacteraceae bacterium]|nr:FxsA family protein [Paracoccaceae bacterium]